MLTQLSTSAAEGSELQTSYYRRLRFYSFQYSSTVATAMAVLHRIYSSWAALLDSRLAASDSLHAIVRTQRRQRHQPSQADNS